MEVVYPLLSRLGSIGPGAVCSLSANNITGSPKSQITKNTFSRQCPDASQCFGGQQAGVENLCAVERRVTETNLVPGINRSFKIAEKEVATAASHLQKTLVTQCQVRFNEGPRCEGRGNDHWRAERRIEVAALPCEVVTPGGTFIGLESRAP